MLRPVLSVLSGLASDSSKALQDNESFNTNMRQGMLVKAANLCVSVAQELVNLITVNMNAECDLLPAPWYNVFCAFCPCPCCSFHVANTFPGAHRYT